MKALHLVPSVEDLKITEEARARLDQWLNQELLDIKSGRASLEKVWRDIMRMYDAVPETPIRNTPIEDASNVEIPLGAMATEGIYSQMIDLIFTLNQPITIRHKHKDYIQRAKAMQKWVDILQGEIKLRKACEHSTFDTCQLGTGFYYVPFVEYYLKHKVYKIIERGPVVYSMMPDDVLISGGPQYEIDDARLVAVRFYLTESELATAKKFRKWDSDLARPAAGGDWLRQRRERISRVQGDLERKTNLYEIHDIYVRYDIDDDGIDEDLLINYDATSMKSLRIRYNPYNERPLIKMCYQIRSHMAYGLGPMEMTAPFQKSLTDVYNHQIDNAFLANVRMFASRYGAVKGGTVNIWAGRNLEMVNPEDIREMKLSDTYLSLDTIQDKITSLAERRTGANELTHPNQNQTFGNRTPVGTSQSLLAQANRRFTPSFDAVRLGTAEAVRQSILRYAERVRGNDTLTIDHLVRELGLADAEQVLDCLRDEHFDKSIGITVTASSNAINKDADRQNAVLLANTLAPYYEKMFQLTATVINPMTPPELRSVAIKICESTSELVDRIIRTFEQFKDPETFIVDPSDEIQASQEMADMQAAMQMGMAMGGMQSGMEGQGGPPQLEGPGEPAPEAAGNGAPPLPTGA